MSSRQCIVGTCPHRHGCKIIDRCERATEIPEDYEQLKDPGGRG